MNNQSNRDARPSTREIAIIAAVAKNGVIGTDQGLPWKLPEDLRRFKNITLGHTDIMGRKTWEILGLPLPKRENIMVSRSVVRVRESLKIASSLSEAIGLATCPDPIFVIGGEHLYKEALAFANLLFLTEIDKEFVGNVYFPAFDRSIWTEVSRERNANPEGVTYDFVKYSRRPPF